MFMCLSPAKLVALPPGTGQSSECGHAWIGKRSGTTRPPYAQVVVEAASDDGDNDDGDDDEDDNDDAVMATVQTSPCCLGVCCGGKGTTTATRLPAGNWIGSAGAMPLTADGASGTHAHGKRAMARQGKDLRRRAACSGRVRERDDHDGHGA